MREDVDSLRIFQRLLEKDSMVERWNADKNTHHFCSLLSGEGSIFQIYDIYGTDIINFPDLWY